MKVPVELAVLEEMRDSWHRRGVALALPVQKIQDALALESGKGPSFTSEEVAAMLTTMAGFYKAVGGEKVLDEILKSVGATSLQPTELPEEGPHPGRRWRIP